MWSTQPPTQQYTQYAQAYPQQYAQQYQHGGQYDPYGGGGWSSQGGGGFFGSGGGGYDPYGGGHGGWGTHYDEQVQDKNFTPSTVPRRCTDVIWCCIFLVSFVVFIGIWIYAAVNGNYGRFFDLRDQNGKLCGHDPEVVGQPYLLFCLDGNVFHYGSRQCVDHCPSMNRVIPGATGACSAEYPTKLYFNNLCIPSEGPELIKSFFNVTTSHPSFTMMMTFSDIPRGSWKPILISASITIVAAFLYMLLIQKCAEPMFYLTIGLLIVSCLLVGLYFFYAAIFTGGADGLPFTGDTGRCWLLGLCATATAAIFFCIAWCKRESMHKAVCCLKAAGECIYDVPILLVEPFISLAAKGTVFIVLLLGLLLLLSCGYVDDLATANSNNHWSGVNFHYGQEELYLVVYYVLMFFWILELCSAFHHFVVSYVVESWFFSDVNSQQMYGQNGTSLTCSICMGYFYAWTRHFGTLAFGSLIVAILRFIQLLIHIMDEASKDTGNSVMHCIFCCIKCCVGCCVDCVKHLTKNAYMATALNADAFCEAARLAVNVLTDNATQVIVLKGATFMFQLAGLGGLVAGGVYLTFLQLKWSPEFNDRHSDSFVGDPTGTLIVAGIACFIVAWPFMALFANAADVILFCYAVQERRKANLAHLQDSAKGALSSVTGFFSGLFGGGGDHKYEKASQSFNTNPHWGPQTQEMLTRASMGTMPHGYYG